MKSVSLIAILLLSLSAAIGRQTIGPEDKQPLLVADPYYWSGPEGNLGIEIVGKFQSEEQLKNHFDLSRNIGLFKAKKYPFQTTKWSLRDVLIELDFNASGSTATWRVCGPKPLLLSYLENLKKQYEDKSLFYDLGYRFITFRPSTD